MFRHKRIVRIIALLLLFNTVYSIFLPSVSYALTAGQHQVEYTSFENAGTTDMVNLSTGDFTYNVPMLEVPGPEGGYSVPLFYHSGLGLEDESSWTGLGWNINVGAIVRNKVSYADDTYDKGVTVNVKDPGGAGYVNNYIVYQRSYDSQKGSGGAVSLFGLAGTAWQNGQGITSYNLVGVTLDTKSGHVSADPTEVIQAVGTIASLLAAQPEGAVAIAGEKAASVGLQALGSALQLATGLAQGYLSQGTWNKSSQSDWSSESTTSNLGFRVDYKYWLDYSRTEYAFGSLYLGSTDHTTHVQACSGCNYSLSVEVPRIGTPSNYALPAMFKMSSGNAKSVGSDMYTPINKNDTYANVFNPTHIAYDLYSVSGAGISGSMAPYRLDVGTLAFPKKLSASSYRYSMVPFLDESTNGKVNFKFNNDFSNTYTYHDNGQGANAAGVVGNPITGSNGNDILYYSMTDPKLSDANNRVEGARPGLINTVTNKRLAQGKHVEWFTNEEMASNIPIFQHKVMEYVPLNSSERMRDSWPIKGIGAFAITREDGRTYHYALPVYNKFEVLFSGLKGQETTKYSEYREGEGSLDGEAYATTWLLTGITGSDFVDRGEPGVIDALDWGHWVKFEYGKFSDGFAWRNPYYGYVEKDGNLTYSTGEKETYYLNAIKTRSHTALFIKDIRQDGKGAYWNNSSGTIPFENRSTPNRYPSSSLKLNQVVLLANADYDNLIQQGFAQDPYGNNPIEDALLKGPGGESTACDLDNVYDIYDVAADPAHLAFLTQKAIKRIDFTYNYSLCSGTLNSFSSVSNPPYTDAADPYATKTGKLTLQALSIYGANNTKLMPDFIFGYSPSNPNYNLYRFDGWGMYNALGTKNSTSHQASGNQADKYAWHLTNITTPLGATMEITYEGDSYASVGGTALSTPKYGGDVRVAKISTQDENGNTYNTGYVYTQDGTTAGVSSGVISKEPDFIRDPSSDLYDYYVPSVFPFTACLTEYDYPTTSVIYGKVTVLNGMKSLADYASRQEYQFITPSTSMISISSQATDKPIQGTVHLGSSRYFKQRYYRVNVQVSQIGKVTAIKSYDSNNMLKQETTFEYTNDIGNKQGTFTTASILSETETSGINGADMNTKFISTNKTYYPTVLKSIRTRAAGMESIQQNWTWDFLTGDVTSTHYQNSLGVKFANSTVLAYQKYPGMGSKAENSANKNMLTQPTAAYIYKLDNAENTVGLISSSVVTWKDDWITYRSYNGSLYTSEVVDLNQRVFRKHQSYIWNGPIVNADGTYQSFIDFNWSLNSSQTENWLKASEAIQYDHYSAVLMNQDVNGNYATQKLGYDQTLATVSATNARYTEIAFSSAEDKVGVGNYFSGEVTGSDKQSNLYAHTGSYSIRLNAGQNGFTYSAKAGLASSATTEVEIDRWYRLSVWIHISDLTAKTGRVFAEYSNGGSTTSLTEVGLASPAVQQAGNWLLVPVRFYLPAIAQGQLLTVGCKNIGSTPVYFDDFRFHPEDSPITTAVYDPRTSRLTYALDGDNLYTRYVYDASGALIRTYREALGSNTSERLVSENSFNYARSK